jgi:putative transcriptional regulator
MAVYMEDLIVAHIDIPALVKDLRKHLGLTQEQLAQELCVTFSTVNQWENGRRRPQPYLLKRLLKMKASIDNDSTLHLAQDRVSEKPEQTVKVAEEENLASMPVAEKLRQLAQLMVSVQQHGRPEGPGDEEEEIRQRWMRLRMVLHG